MDVVPMSGRLHGKVIIVSGGSSGIGRAVAQRVASEGAAVVVGARRREEGAEVAAGIEAAGGPAMFVAADATVETEAAGLVTAAIAAFGRLDGAFNNAGGVQARGALSDIDEADWRGDLEQNLTSVFFGLKYQLAPMIDAGAGSIVNNASIAGTAGVPTMAPYVAAKHGVVGLTRAAALETADRGVRVNALVTGNVDTPLYRGLLGAAPDDPLTGRAPNPTGRVAQPEEIAGFVAFLLSDEAAFITGAALAIDGGATA
ncbi:MAG TPA: SDR family oxidoreductase [Acidimicrobiales bacterium]|jgi:NAD(P)-dependent dehydrogenase (short-subunit alcohol dehydrogenase family)